MRSAVFHDAVSATSDIPHGAVIGIGGFGVPHRWPSGLIMALRDRNIRDLTVVCNTLGFGPFAPQVLAENRQIRRLIGCFGGSPYRKTAIQEQIARGDVEFEMVAQGTLVERLRAGAGGIPAFYTPTGVGTQVAEGKEQRRFDGQEFMLEKALKVSFSFIRAHRGDTRGNLTFRGASRNLNPLFAMAADVTIAEVDEIVEAGDLDPESVIVPGVFVDGVVRGDASWDSQAVRSELRTLGRSLGGSSEESIGLSRDLMALRASRLLQAGQVVNLGMGMPTLIGNYLLDEQDVVLQSENGILGYGRLADDEEVDEDVYNAGGQPVTLCSGSSFFDSSLSFAMIRGGHLDVAILGGLQVSEQGDLANWSAPNVLAGGVGGAMDLATGVAKVVVVMEHSTKGGEPKIVRHCSYPLTAPRCVSIILTNLGLIEVRPEGLVLKELAPGLTVEDVQRHTQPDLTPAPDLKEMEF